MPLLSQITTPATVSLTTFATGYALTIAAVSLAAIAARTPERRRDARNVLAILLPRRKH